MSMASSIQRCAIYTRKSTEEGLDQEFNSLDAQREACEAYIKSQHHEGWRVINTAYDDGGISGGTMERPGLKRLLSDIEAGLIDTVVVYKVDRLTRALPDFAKMVEIFDAKEVSFVSVTQSFNTTSSMGRLTLNVLLSFAQFEREVTAERIRDKIAASRKKGMWMGGAVPLGYVARKKALYIDPKSAKTVRQIFERYAALGSVKAVRAELREDNTGSVKPSKKKSAPGFCGSALYWILRNPIYCGDVRHKEKIYPGQHEAIIPREEWDAVQRLLDAQSSNDVSSSKRGASSRMLNGILFDQSSTPLKTDIAARRIKTKEGPVKKHYWYYQTKPSADTKPLRIPVDELDRIVIKLINAHFKDASYIASAFDAPSMMHLAAALERSASIAEKLEQLTDLKSRDTITLIRDLIARIDITASTITLSLKAGCLAANTDDPLAQISLPPITSELYMHQFARNKPIVISTDHCDANRDPDLIAMIADARRWLAAIKSGDATSIDALTKSEGKANGVISRALPLAFLAPDITDAILSGHQPKSLTASTLRDAHPIPASWSEQRSLLGFELSKSAFAPDQSARLRAGAIGTDRSVPINRTQLHDVCCSRQRYEVAKL